MRPLDVPVPLAHDGELACYSFGQLAGPGNPNVGDDGTAMLWLINRCVFHPRGYALALHYREDPQGGTDPQPVGWSIIDSGDGTPWRYSEDQQEDQAYALVERILAHAREHGSAPAREDLPEPD